MPSWVCNWHPRIENERYKTAIHEAGHCVACLSFGWRFAHLSIQPTGKTKGYMLSAAHRHQGDHRYPLMLLAGPAAEARFSGCDLAHICTRGGRSDMSKALAAVAQLQEPPTWPALARAAQQLIEAEWRRVELVAQALVQHQRLTFDEVVALLASVPSARGRERSTF